jgi:hypothetical protein
LIPPPLGAGETWPESVGPQPQRRVVAAGTIEAEYHNAENLILADSPQIAAIYAANWLAHKAHSVP